MRRLVTILGFILTIFSLPTNHAVGQTPPRPLPKNEAVNKLLTTQLQAAQKAQLAAIDAMQLKAVGGVMVLVNSNHPHPEEAYTWSVRWLHAQRDLGTTKDERIAACTDHVTRMKDLRARVSTLVGDGKGGFTTPADAAVAAPAAEWYLAEAELWLLKERGG